MLDVVDTGINSFARVASQADVSPSEEPVFIITSGQLQDLVTQAIERATAPLEARLQDLQARINALGERGVGPREGREDLQDQAHKPGSSPDGSLDGPPEAQGSHLLQARIICLEDENRGLKEALELLQEATARERAYDRQRIARLERVDPQPLQRDRGEILRALIAANGGKMLAKEARQKMRLSKQLFSMLLSSMGDDLEIKPLHIDNRKLVLILRTS